MGILTNFISLVTSMRLLPAFILALVFTSGCLRYTPPRASLTEDKSGVVISDEAFYQFDITQKNRLQKLIEERLANSAMDTQSTYRIAPGDVIQVSVFDVPEFKDLKVRVRPSGTISLPLIGLVIAEGKTEPELQEEIITLLTRFVKTPQVSVFIAEYEGNKVYVVGEVARPGSYPVKRNDYSLVEVLSEVGGKTERGSGRIVLVPAQENRKERTSGVVLTHNTNQALNNGIEIYFDDLIGSANKRPLFVPLRVGDTIIVPEAGSVQVDGEVKTPGSYPLSSRMTLLGAVASAGGLSYSADVDQVEVIREIEAGKKVSLAINLEKLAVGEGKDVRLRDGDIVRVPSHSGRFATRQVIEVINKTLTFGVGGL